MMTGMERFGAVMQGKLPDRVPVICNLFDQGARELGLSIEEYYSKGEYVAEGQTRLREKYGYDLVWAYFYAGHVVELLGCQKIMYAEDGPPNVGHLVIQKNTDIETFDIPEDIAALPQFQKLRTCITLLRQEHGGKYPIAALALPSFTLPMLLMGTERWYDLLFFGSHALRDELLEKCAIFCGRLVHALRAAGVDLIVYANPMASVDLITLEQFNTLALPWIKRDIEHIGSPDGILYFCGGGRINPTIPSLIDDVGFETFYVHPFDDIAETKRLVGSNGISSGTINDIGLLTWSKEEIQQEVKRIMLAGAPGGRFLFSTLVMPYLIPEDNIRTMLEAAYRYGNYDDFLKRVLL